VHKDKGESRKKTRRYVASDNRLASDSHSRLLSEHAIDFSGVRTRSCCADPPVSSWPVRARPNQLSQELYDGDCKKDSSGLTGIELARLKEAVDMAILSWLVVEFDGRNLHFLPEPPPSRRKSAPARSLVRNKAR
jgi:hypothetical protein